MLTRCKDIKLKILKIKISSKYHGRYKQCYEKKDTWIIVLVFFMRLKHKTQQNCIGF